MEKTRANKFMLLNILYFIFISKPVFILILSVSGDLGNNPIYTLIMSSITLNLIPITLYMLLTKSNIKEVIPLKKISLKTIFIIILISYFIQPLISLIGYITNIFFETKVSTEIIEISQESSYLYMILSVCIIPAILEELVCRGIYLSGFKNKNLIKASIMCGIFFGIMHFNWEQFFYASIMGMVFSVLVRVTGSIYSSIISHFIINASSVSSIFILKSVYNILGLNTEDLISMYTSQTENIILEEILPLIIGAIVSILITIFLFKKLINDNKDNLNDNGIDDNTKVIDKYFILSVVLYIIYMIYLKN